MNPEPQTEDALSLVPDLPVDVPDSLTWRVLCPEIRTAADIIRYQMADAFARTLTEQRKTQNRRIIELVGAWERRKHELRDDLLAVLAQSQGKVGTLLGTTYTTAKPKWGIEIKDEMAVIAWLRESAADIPRNKAGEPLVELKEQLSDAGKAFVREFIETTTPVNGVVPPGVEVSPPRDTVATRFKGKVSIDQLRKMDDHGSLKKLADMQAEYPDAFDPRNQQTQGSKDADRAEQPELPLPF